MKRVYTLRAERVYIACGEGGTHEEGVYFSCVNRAPNFQGASIFPVGYILSEFFRTGCHEFYFCVACVVSNHRYTLRYRKVYYLRSNHRKWQVRFSHRFFSIYESVYDGYPSFMSNRSRATDLGLILGVGWESIFIFTQKVQKKFRLKGKK